MRSLPPRRRALVGTALVRGCALLVLGGLLSSCSLLQTLALQQVHARDVLSALDTRAPDVPPFPPPEEALAELFRQSLADGYFEPVQSAQVLTRPQVGERVRDAVLCLARASGGAAAESCLDALILHLGFEEPPNPGALSPTAWMREQDVVRLEENLGAAVRAAAAYERTSRGEPFERDAQAIQHGALRGISAFLAYQAHRGPEHRRDHARPTTALVLAGGAANGAFSAGAVWWLLTSLQRCTDAARARLAACTHGTACEPAELLALGQGCLADRVDLVAGASTGALIAVLVKDYFGDPGTATGTPDLRTRALDELVRRYTCSTNGDLYCVVDKSLYDLASDQGTSQGLVRFDGISALLDGYVTPHTFAAHPEYFASTVEFRSGRVLHLSSLDPLDLPDVTAFKQGVLASLVEPAMAEPVPRVGRLTGLFLDGGVRSGLPLSTPLQRGAERAVVLVNGTLEPLPRSRPPANAAGLALRTLELFTAQPIVSELHEAETGLVLRRVSEYERCVERLAKAHPSADEPAQPGLSRTTAPARIQDLCAGRAWPEPPGQPPRAMVTQPGPPLVKSVPNAYQSAWVFEPDALPPHLEELAPGARWEQLAQVGYQFEPKAMWSLFALGAAVAQTRCAELTQVLGWHLPRGPGSCGDFEALAATLRPLRDHAQTHCWNRDNGLRMCRER